MLPKFHRIWIGDRSKPVVEDDLLEFHAPIVTNEIKPLFSFLQHEVLPDSAPLADEIDRNRDISEDKDWVNNQVAEVTFTGFGVDNDL